MLRNADERTRRRFGEEVPALQVTHRVSSFTPQFHSDEMQMIWHEAAGPDLRVGPGAPHSQHSSRYNR